MNMKKFVQIINWSSRRMEVAFNERGKVKEISVFSGHFNCFLFLIRITHLLHSNLILKH